MILWRLPGTPAACTTGNLLVPRCERAATPSEYATPYQTDWYQYELYVTYAKLCFSTATTLGMNMSFISIYPLWHLYLKPPKFVGFHTILQYANTSRCFILFIILFYIPFLPLSSKRCFLGLWLKICSFSQGIYSFQ